jgi:large subunit ribosomal protein L21
MEHEGTRLFAVIKTGGKQYSVAAGDTITVMALAGNPGDRVTFDRVLMLSQDGEPALGTPFVDGASVGGQIVEQTRGPKAIAFKKRRRKNSKRKHGHRQDLTLVRITELRTGGAKLSAEGETTGAN